MTDFLIIFGALFSILASIFGILKNKHWLLLLGALLYIPPCYYLNNAFNGIIFLPLLNIGSMVAVHNNRKLIAWLFLLPEILLALVFLLLGLVFGLLMEKGVVY